MQNNKFILTNTTNKITNDKKFILNSHYSYIRNLWEKWKFSCLEPTRTNELISFNHFLSWTTIWHFPLFIINLLYILYGDYSGRNYNTLPNNLLINIILITIILILLYFIIFYFYISKDYKNYSIKTLSLFYKIMKKNSINKTYYLTFPALFLSSTLYFHSVVLFYINNFYIK